MSRKWYLYKGEGDDSQGGAAYDDGQRYVCVSSQNDPLAWFVRRDDLLARIDCPKSGFPSVYTDESQDGREFPLWNQEGKLTNGADADMESWFVEHKKKPSLWMPGQWKKWDSATRLWFSLHESILLTISKFGSKSEPPWLRGQHPTRTAK